jgi:hypothetical protein
MLQRKYAKDATIKDLAPNALPCRDCRHIALNPLKDAFFGVDPAMDRDVICLQAVFCSLRMTHIKWSGLP